MSDRSLLVYAVVANLTNGNCNVVEGLAPVFRYVASKIDKEIFDSESYSSKLKELFGIDIHPWAVDGITKKLSDMGVIRIEKRSPTSQAIYYYIKGDIDAYEGGEILNEVNEKYISYCRDNFPMVDESDEVILDNFYKFISDISLDGEYKNDKGIQKVNVYAASFVILCKEKIPDIYAKIAKVADGLMLAEAVLNVRNPESQYSLSGVSIMLDTPTFLEYCDLSLREKCNATRRFIDKLKDLGAFLYILPHTKEELEEVIKSTYEATADHRGYGPLSNRIKFDIVCKKIVETAISDFDVLLKPNKISVKSFDYSVINPSSISEIVSEFSPRENGISPKRDATSILVLEYLNKTPVHYADFFKQPYTMITKNPDFARVSSGRRNKKSHFPSVLTEKEFATLVWLSFGGASAEIGKLFLVSSCMDALDPDARLVEKVRLFVSKLDQNNRDIFEGCFSDRRASQMLTLYEAGYAGSASLESEEGIGLLLEEMKALLIAEERQKLLEEQQEAIAIVQQDLSQRIVSLEREKDEEAFGYQVTLENSEKTSRENIDKYRKIIDRKDELLTEVTAESISKDLEREAIAKELSDSKIYSHDRNLRISKKLMRYTRYSVYAMQFTLFSSFAVFGIVAKSGYLNNYGISAVIICSGLAGVCAIQRFWKKINSRICEYVYTKLSELIDFKCEDDFIVIEFDEMSVISVFPDHLRLAGSASELQVD